MKIVNIVVRRNLKLDGAKMFEDYILIQKIKNGDQNAFERVIEKYYHSIYFYCVRRCYGNVELAADLALLFKILSYLHAKAWKFA